MWVVGYLGGYFQGRIIAKQSLFSTLADLLLVFDGKAKGILHKDQLTFLHSQRLENILEELY